MISSFFDPPKATAAANALLGEDINFLFAVMDEPSFLQVANDAGVWAAAWNTDVRQFGPDVYVNTLQLDFGPYYLEQAKAALAGTWIGQDRSPTCCRSISGTGATRCPRTSAPRSTSCDRSCSTARSIPYTGPIVDNKGTERLGGGRDPRRPAGLPHRLGRRGCVRRRRLTPDPPATPTPQRPATTLRPTRRRSRRATSRRASTGSGRCATSISSCVAARCTRCSARTAPARRRCATCSPASTAPMPATIEVDGIAHQFHSPAQAIAAGIGMVHQHFRLVAPMTRGRERPPRLGRHAGAGHPSRARRPHQCPDGRVRSARRPGGQDLAALGRRAAARGDPADAGAGNANPDPRRTDRGAHHRRGRASCSP